MITGAGWVGGAEHRGVPAVWVPQQRGQHLLLARHGIPDDEVIVQEIVVVPDHTSEEDAAVASVDRAAVVVVEGTVAAEGGGGDEAEGVPINVVGKLLSEVAEEGQHGGPAVELAESAAEAAAGDEAAPGLPDEGGAHEARGRREGSGEGSLPPARP